MPISFPVTIVSTIGDCSALGAHQSRLIYCNGIESTIEQAVQEQGKLISDAFGGRGVTVVCNPTKVSHYFNLHTAEQDAFENSVADTLLQQIQDQMQGASTMDRTERKKVILFAHSHGTQILLKALQKLSPEERPYVTVYTFGGITMIPKNLAHKVEIYFNEGDIIGKSGNRAHDSEKVLENYLKIEHRMRVEGVDCKRAIINQVLDDTHDKLDPFHHDAKDGDQVRADKVARHGATFFGGQKMDPKNLEEGVRQYTKCYTDYNIHLIPSTILKGQSEDATDLDFRKLSEVVADEVGTFVLTSNYKCHILPNFEKIIQNIAEQTMQEEARL